MQLNLTQHTPDILTVEVTLEKGDNFRSTRETVMQYLLEQGIVGEIYSIEKGYENITYYINPLNGLSINVEEYLRIISTL